MTADFIARRPPVTTPSYRRRTAFCPDLDRLLIEIQRPLFPLSTEALHEKTNDG